MKQTAVEWFAMITKELGYVSEAQLEQAKEMHKQEIMDAFYKGMNCQNFDPNKGRAKQYYNETFKSEQ